MKNIIYIFFLSLLFAFRFSLFAAPTYAGLDCQPIYGGGQTCIATGNIVVNKKVLNPVNNTFVDNLGVNDPKYAPGFIANFRLEVTNTSNANIARADVKDIFPQYVEFSTGPGNFDSSTKTLTFTVENLAPNETRIFAIVGRVVGMDQLPVNQGVVCVVNQAIATANEGAMSQDNSQFCIEKKALAPTTTKGGFPVLPPTPITTVPSTGPSALSLLLLTLSAVAGFIIRKNYK